MRKFTDNDIINAWFAADESIGVTCERLGISIAQFRALLLAHPKVRACCGFATMQVVYVPNDGLVS